MGADIFETGAKMTIGEKIDELEAIDAEIATAEAVVKAAKAKLVAIEA